MVNVVCSGVAARVLPCFLLPPTDSMPLQNPVYEILKGWIHLWKDTSRMKHTVF